MSLRYLEVRALATWGIRRMTSSNFWLIRVKRSGRCCRSDLRDTVILLTSYFRLLPGIHF